MAKRNTDNFNPYHQWLGIPKSKCPPTHYELLGISLNEDEHTVIKSAADRQRSHVEQFLGTEFNSYANKLISQIDEAEITLLSPELRREYDRKVKLFKKRRKKRQIDPNASPSQISSNGNRSVGEGSGFLREYAGIVAILAIAFFGMAAASFWLPWGKVEPEKVVAKNQPVQEKEPAPEPEIPVQENEVLHPEPEMLPQPKPIPQPKKIAESNLARIDVTIQSLNLPNQTITVSRNSNSTILSFREDSIILIGDKVSSINTLVPNQVATITFDPVEDVISKIEVTPNSVTPNESFISPSKINLISVKRIWDKSPSNAFTDLCFFKNNFYCVFREGENRMATTSTIRILKSSDGEIWKPIEQIQIPQIDLRDPKINVTADGKLMLSAGGRKKLGNNNQYQTIAAFSDDGQQWSKPIPIGEPNMWLWSPTWNEETLYVVGYHTKEPRKTKLYKSEDGSRMKVLSPNFQNENMPVETALTFPTPTQAICIQRKFQGKKTATIGMSQFPFKEWDWEDTGQEITSPELITLPNGKIFLACKLKNVETETVLFSVNPDTKNLTKLLKLPSAGDQGYPGLFFVNGHLWMSYHSSHQGKTAIYVAKLSMK